MMPILLLVLLACVLCAPAQARVYAPRVVSPHNADAYSLKTFAQHPRWAGLKGDALAWEVYQYLVDRRTGIFHMHEVLEGRDALSEFQTIRDPIKILNVYGYGYCYIFGPTVATLCEGIGLGRGRMLWLKDWSHVVAEAFYDGKWHYLDADVRAVFRRRDGTLASMEDASRDDSLWAGPHGPLFFPHDNLPRVREIYAKTPINRAYGFGFTGHTMDYVLRPGETFTRWWKPQGGRWHHSEVFDRTPFVKALLEQEPRGPRSNHPEFTVHTHGNGRFVYRPNLTSRSGDFADGVYDAENVAPSANGITLRRAGEGHAIFEVRSPYILVPRVGRTETTEDDREASVVKLQAEGAALSLSTDNGLTWADLGPAREVMDLTPHVSGRYGYLLKIGLKGRPGEALVRSLEIATWVQVAPASLPSLRRGVNRMEFRTGDHYGLPTRVVEIRTNGSDRADFLKYLVEPPADYDPDRKTSRVRGAFVARVDAPPNARIAWFSAGANFQTHQGADAAKTRNAMAYSADAPRDFIPIYQADVPTDQGHWHDNADREVRLPRPAKSLFIRYVGDPGVNNLRIYAHCLDDTPPAPAPVTITHAWREGGALKTKQMTLPAPGPYEVMTEAEPEDEYVELSVASTGAR